MIKPITVLVLATLLLVTFGVSHAQQFEITCAGGIPQVVPSETGVILTCATYTPAAAAEETPIATATLTPTATLVPIPTATATPTAIPIVPTVTPSQPPAPSPTATGQVVQAELAAFPGAQGFGAQTVGGRGGTVYKVTTLADSGAGSLRACVTATGPRTCIFDTGGTIELLTTLEVRNPYLTIAGQSAPGGGITLKVKDPAKSIDLFKISTYEVIVRYVTFRPGTQDANARCMSINAGGQASTANLAANIIIDHISCSWAGDEILIAWDRSHHITFQYSIFSEPISPGWKGPNLGKYGGGPYTFWRNLVAHVHFRTPNSSASGGTTEIVNNVIYNFNRFGMRATLGSMSNIINNWIAAGPATLPGAVYVRNDLDVQDPDSSLPIPNPMTRGFYEVGNHLAPYRGAAKITSVLPNNVPAAYVKSAPYPNTDLPTLSAQDAYEEVLTNSGNVHALTCAGAWIVRMDSVDTRVRETVRTERSSSNTEPPSAAYLKSPAEVGGWPPIAPGLPCQDSDGDGMSNEWEQLHGLDNNLDDSASDTNGDGYSNIEAYLSGRQP